MWILSFLLTSRLGLLREKSWELKRTILMPKRALAAGCGSWGEEEEVICLWGPCAACLKVYCISCVNRLPFSWGCASQVVNSHFL